MMKCWMLVLAAMFLVHSVDGRERWGPPPDGPPPKEDCKPKWFPKAPPPKECKPKPEPCCPPVCFERGFPTNSCCTPSAYSEPAAIELRCGWDVFATLNFIYWEALQGGMDLAVPGQARIAGGILSLADRSAVGQSILKQEFEYKPGFQIGLGWSGGRDNWVLYAEYTWLHGSTDTSGIASAPGVASINGVPLPQDGIWLPTSWFPNSFINNATTQISSTWTYKIDLVDAQISRPFYLGARLTVEPFFGLRGAVIRQHMSLSALNIRTPDLETLPDLRHGHYNSRARGIGPRVGMNGNWHLGYGIRFIGNGSASLLFTGYDVKGNVETSDGAQILDHQNEFPVRIKISDLNVLRPNLDLSLGLGWGSYFRCRKYHWDLAATYDFSIFWEQNMIRYLADVVGGFTGASPSDLYLQGLTIRTQFDF